MKKITTEGILAKTNMGLDIFKHIIPNLKQQSELKCFNVHNPLDKEDTKPSFSVYRMKPNSPWLFKHWGEPPFSGDSFTLFDLYSKLDPDNEFPGVLEKLNELIDSGKIKTGKPVESLPVTKTIQKEKTQFKLFERKFNKEELVYWDSYGITANIRKWKGLIAIKGFIEKKNGRSRTVYSESGQMMFAFEEKDFAFIYQPLSDKYKFQYVGEKPKDYIFGLNNLSKQAKSPVIFLTGGRKDVLMLAGLKYPAICLNSETADIPNWLIEDWKERDLLDKIVILYDIDETGLKSSKKLSEKYGLKRLELPKKLLDGGGKDISDYVQLELSKEEFHQSVQGVLEVDQEKKEKKGRPPIDQESPESSKSSEYPVINIESDPGDYIDSDVYSKLPTLLKDGIDVFKTRREKDIFLLGTLGVLSNCLPNVYSLYDGRRIFPNIFMLILANAGSYKSTLNYSRKLAEPLEDFLIKASKKAYKEYREAMGKYELEKEDNPDAVEPEKPLKRRIFIPTNSSHTAILRAMADNGERATIIDTEADTLSNSIAKEWSDYSTLIRKAFHHEFDGSLRMMEERTTNIRSPKLSLILSGTPKQLFSLIPDTENGLFSRFCFYSFKSKDKFRNVLSSKNNYDKEAIFEQLGGRLIKIFKELDCKEEEILFTFSEEQAEEHYEFFYPQFDDLSGIFGEDIEGSVKRLGVVFQRIAMILSILRNRDLQKPYQQTLTCTEMDFEITKTIVKTLIRHMVKVFKSLKSNASHPYLKGEKKAFFDKLPNEFNRQQANEVAKSIGLNLTTADKYLRAMVEQGLLEKPKHNWYVKNEYLRSEVAA